MTRPNTPEDIWARITKGEGCWLWQGGKQSRGYGAVGWHGHVVQVHRLIYELTYGPIPEGMVVRHKCDVLLCCRPDHLELGWQRDNIADMVQRGRSRKGEQRPQAKLTEETVREMRRLYATGQWTQQELAEQCGVSHTAIGDALSGTNWGHIQDVPAVRCTWPRNSRSHCQQGHEFTPENTIVLKGGGRRCRACFRAYQNTWYARRHKGRVR